MIRLTFLLGVSDKTSTKINEKNLLNFYLSSVTIKNFNYTPSEKTKKEIWKYLNAANLIKINDVNDNRKINELELAASQGKVSNKLIFDIYKQITFNINNLINAENIYQTFENTEARALVYQKFLLSEDVNSKIKYLFLLEDLFRKDGLQSVYSKVLTDRLLEVGLENIPEEYQEVAQNRVEADKENNVGKIKYNDKILHQSRIIRFYIEEEDEKKFKRILIEFSKRLVKTGNIFILLKILL